MPHYRVIVEFDHPGEGHKLPSGDLTRSPEKWRWTAELLGDDASNVRLVECYEARTEWVRVDAASGRQEP